MKSNTNNFNFHGIIDIIKQYFNMPCMIFIFSQNTIKTIQTNKTYLWIRNLLGAGIEPVDLHIWRSPMLVIYCKLKQDFFIATLVKAIM